MSTVQQIDLSEVGVRFVAKTGATETSKLEDIRFERAQAADIGMALNTLDAVRRAGALGSEAKATGAQFTWRDDVIQIKPQAAVQHTQRTEKL